MSKKTTLGAIQFTIPRDPSVGEITRKIEARLKEARRHRRYAAPTGWLPGFEVIEADLPVLKRRGSSAKKKVEAKAAKKTGKKKG